MTRLQQLSKRIATLQVEFEQEKNRLRWERLGQHEGATVYETKPTRVKSYTRRGYRAVRVRR